MLYFNQDLYKKALEIVKEMHDLSDVANDLKTIEFVWYAGRDAANIQRAKKLNRDLREKYPTIDEMMAIGNSLPKAPANPLAQYQPPDELEFLRQDYCGILCDTLMKKQITTSIEEFIDKADGTLWQIKVSK